MKTSDYQDFSWRPRFWWRLQSLFIPGVRYYYDVEQKAYCKKIINVKGNIRLCKEHHIKGTTEMCFVPNDIRHPFVKYHQRLLDHSLT